MISKKEIKGFICATENHKEKLFSEKDIQLCKVLAEQFMEGYSYFCKEESKKVKK